MVDELVDGKLDVSEPSSQKPDISEPSSRKLENRAEPSSRKPENGTEPSSRKPDIRVGPIRKPELHREDLASSRKPESRGQADNHQDLTTSGKFENPKLVDGKFDNLDERDEDEKAQEVSHSQSFQCGHCPNLEVDLEQAYVRIYMLLLIVKDIWQMMGLLSPLLHTYQLHG